MHVDQILSELAAMGAESTKKTLMRHGAREPFFGVKVGDMKKIVKREKKNHALSLALYETGNSDAMYLAGLLADEKKITADDLRRWAEGAYWYMLSEYTVAWVAAESAYGWVLGLEWIDSPVEHIAASGWSTLASLATIKPDAELDLGAFERLLDRVERTLHTSANRVRYAMNVFVIATGGSVTPLTGKALEVAARLGKVTVDMDGTACAVPSAVGYIEKMRAAGKLGYKKKMARC